MTDSTVNESAKSWKNTSEQTDAINHILSLVNCPTQVRNLINILVGMSDGKAEFETTHKNIATRMRMIEDDLSDKNAKQAVKRAHRNLKKVATSK